MTEAVFWFTRNTVTCFLNGKLVSVRACVPAFNFINFIYKWWLSEASHSISSQANQVPVAYPSLRFAAIVVFSWLCWLCAVLLSSRFRSCKESIMLTVVQPYPVSRSALFFPFFFSSWSTPQWLCVSDKNKEVQLPSTQALKIIMTRMTKVVTIPEC